MIFHFLSFFALNIWRVPFLSTSEKAPGMPTAPFVFSKDSNPVSKRAVLLLKFSKIGALIKCVYRDYFVISNLYLFFLLYYIYKENNIFNWHVINFEYLFRE